MALRDAEQHWTDDERYYAYSSERDSDDSPIFRNEKRRYGPAKVYGRPHRRTTFSILAKFFLVCSAMILFCCLLYVPVFMRVDRHVVRAVLDGWSMDTNRDTSLYVRPHNKTTIYEPDDVCPKTGRERDKRNRLFLLVIVCSSTNNFHRRAAIRNTWGDYKKYLKLSKVFHDVREKYKNYNFSYSLFPELESNVTKVAPTRRVKRDISSFNDLLPELAKALEKRVLQKAETVEVPDKKEEMLHQFDMNKELGDNDVNNDLIEDYEYVDNIMKIPRKGENISNNFESLIVDYLLKQSKDTDSFVENLEAGNTELDYKLVFLLGLPTQKDSEEVQSRIDSEVNEYNDIIQEDFLDTYNNLTLKSIMMLKWVTNNCQDSVRYILKTDDDVYVNVPHLMMNLRNRSQLFDNQTLATGKAREEHLLIGDLICGARPVLDSRDKWYSPRYMFSGKKYPHYLSGSAYALTAAAGAVLYRAALTTRYFHLEDIFITGMVPKRTQPPLAPTEDTMFTFSRARGACGPHIFATTHRIEAQQMQRIVKRLLSRAAVEFCEKERLTQVRTQIEKQKQKAKTAPGVKYHTRTVIMN